mmetsp:Transcript_12266/g.23820  ORF Transcript_12266/g.23820 Transcript_12266/m.23820 type:complete len:300 (-) Transcript_12266:233-1132(-)
MLRSCVTTDASSDLEELRPRLSLNHEERLRYTANVERRRPYVLEVLRWNHDPPPEQIDERADAEETCSNEEIPDYDTFEQLECLTGSYRCVQSGEPSGGIAWKPCDHAGVFLRHAAGSVLVWLPEAGPNFLVQGAAGKPWFLLEVARLAREEVVVEHVVNNVHKKEGKRLSRVSILRCWNTSSRQHVADAHLTDDWIQAVDDLRTLWSWDWHPVRDGSPFLFAHLKYGYRADYPLADKHVCGTHGEDRWLWRWLEDGQGGLSVHNRSWREDATFVLDRHAAKFCGIGGEDRVWDGQPPC